MATHPTIQRRLGQAFITGLQAGNTLAEHILRSSGADIRAEYAARWIAQSSGGGPRLLIMPLPFKPAVRLKGSAYSKIPLLFHWELWDDQGLDIAVDNLPTVMNQLIASPETYFNTWLSDVEGNLPSKDGELEFDEDLQEGFDTGKPQLAFKAYVSVWHKFPLLNS